MPHIFPQWKNSFASWQWILNRDIELKEGIEREGERERQREGEGGRERERASSHQIWFYHPQTVRYQCHKRSLYSPKIMDGTKPAMDSNAEENQDEGQESKGTPADNCRFLVYFPTFIDVRVCASPSALLAMAQQNICVIYMSLFPHWLLSHLGAIWKRNEGSLCCRRPRLYRQSNPSFCTCRRIWRVDGCVWCIY